MFDIHQSIRDDHNEEIDESRVGKYIDGLMTEFEASPEAQPILQEHRLGWAASFMNYAFTYLGAELPEMSLPDFDKVVFDLIPRKVSTEAESADAIIVELRAFWSFLDRAYNLPSARKILDTLTDEATARLRAALSNPSNFGMAKSFFMMGKEAGFDMTTQEGLDAFMLVYNASILSKQGIGLPPAPIPVGMGAIGSGLGLFSPGLTKQEREKKRKARKAQRQARKRHRK